MTFTEFLDKETPSYGGCMLCETRDGNGYSLYRVVARYKLDSGDMFVVNGHNYDFYETGWNPDKPWNVLYKKIK